MNKEDDTVKLFNEIKQRLENGPKVSYEAFTDEQVEVIKQIQKTCDLTLLEDLCFSESILFRITLPDSMSGKPSFHFHKIDLGKIPDEHRVLLESFYGQMKQNINNQGIMGFQLYNAGSNRMTPVGELLVGSDENQNSCIYYLKQLGRNDNISVKLEETAVWYPSISLRQMEEIHRKAK